MYLFIYLFITPINKKVLSLQTVFFVPLPLPASLPSKKIARIGQKDLEILVLKPGAVSEWC